MTRRSITFSWPLIVQGLVAVPLAAQQTWPASTQEEFLAALAAAAPGDIVQLAPSGEFNDFTLTKGLTIRGPATIGNVYGMGNGRRFARVPAGQVAQFVDLTFAPDPPPVIGYSAQGSLEVSGVVRFDRCELRGSAFAAALIAVDADVVVTHCSIRGQDGAAGISALRSHLSLTDTSVEGAGALRGPLGSGPAKPGIACSDGGSLHASHVEVRGGRGGDWQVYGFALPASAIESDVDTWLTDSTAVGGSITGPYPGADAVVGSAIAYARCTFIGGEGTPPGEPFAGRVRLDPTLLGATSSSALRLGAPVTMTFVTGGMLDIVVVACTRLGPARALPVVTQPLWLGAPPVLFGCRWNAPFGSVSCTFVVPADPALANRSLDLIALRWGGVGLEASPLLGGVMR
jgi:hypothetical protein